MVQTPWSNAPTPANPQWDHSGWGQPYDNERETPAMAHTPFSGPTTAYTHVAVVNKPGKLLNNYPPYVQ